MEVALIGLDEEMARHGPGRFDMQIADVRPSNWPIHWASVDNLEGAGDCDFTIRADPIIREPRVAVSRYLPVPFKEAARSVPAAPLARHPLSHRNRHRQ